MAKIHILPDEIVSKIAAGEVIERPASVIKETMENSIDSGATDIRVEIGGAGKKLIRISDNGSGISAEDMEKIFLRHSTSKIENLGDLDKIQTLGFRGEALYSICAVSDVAVLSKTSQANSGFQIHCRGSQRMSLKPAARETGTTIEINELFFNTPARKKFLKSDSTEFSRIISVFLPYTLLHPQISFSLIHNGLPVYKLEPVSETPKRISQALNLNQEDFIAVKKDFPSLNLKVSLILGDINTQKSTRGFQFLFVNNRPVNHKSILFHLNQAYRLIMPEGVNPVFAVFIRVPPEDVDVNVHPAKREVKLKHDRQAAETIRQLCETALLDYSRAKQVKSHITEIPETAMPPAGYPTLPSYTPDPGSRCQSGFEFKPNPNGEIEISAANTSNLREKLHTARFLAVFADKYLIFEAGDSLLLIDQHAAHERVNYEKLKLQIKEGKLEVQRLLTPITIRLTKQELLDWENLQETLDKLGFSTTLWDNESLAIHSHPQLIFDPHAAIRSILSEETAETTSLDIDALARRACRNSVMFGQQINRAQAEYIKEALAKTSNPLTCPHGRPTVIEITQSFLSRQFLR